MIAYEKISNLSNKAAAKLADEALSVGWTRRNYPSVVLEKGSIPWAFSGQQERSWNFYIHSWDMLDALLKTHSETQLSRYLELALEVALDWHDYVTANQADLSPFAWYDMAVGLRAYRLAYLFEASESSGLLSEEQKNQLWEMLKQHQHFLEDDNNVVYHNNHGFYQAAGQLAMGRRFAGRCNTMRLALDQGKSRLLKMLETQFASDGVHREHSPDYHRIVYETLRGVLDAGLVTDPEIIAFAEKIEEALSWFVLPNQRLANFGDSDYRLVSTSVEAAQQRWTTDAMRYVSAGGKLGKPPAKSLAVFPEGGYFIVRAPVDDDQTNFQQQSYLAQQAAFHSRTHKHADTLSFIWHEYGNDILVDSGRYGYLGKTDQGSELWKDGHWYSDPNRIYCESTRAHNVLEFDGANYPRKGIRPFGSVIGRHLAHESGVFMLETEARHFKGVRHARVLLYLPKKWLIVFDWFKDNNEQKHDVRQWFHFAPELHVMPDGKDYLSILSGSDEPLRVVSLLQEPCSSSLLYAEETPQLQGWLSPSERVIVPAYALSLNIYGITQGNFATLFTFSKELKVNRQASRVNVSGRQGHFVWQDERGNHEVRMYRPEHGNFNVDYIHKKA
jgi:hypothetical protein